MFGRRSISIGLAALFGLTTLVALAPSAQAAPGDCGGTPMLVPVTVGLHTGGRHVMNTFVSKPSWVEVTSVSIQSLQLEVFRHDQDCTQVCNSSNLIYQACSIEGGFTYTFEVTANCCV